MRLRLSCYRAVFAPLDIVGLFNQMCKPVLFIDTPMKVMNPEYQRIQVEPINIWMREQIGAVLKPEEMNQAAGTVADLLSHAADYQEKIDSFVKEYVYNLGSSAEVGAKYIIASIQNKIKERKALDKS